MSAEAGQGGEPRRASAASWAIEHVPFTRGLYTARRPSGLTADEPMLAAPLDAVRLRHVRQKSAAGDESLPLVVFFPDARTVAQRGRRSGDGLASTLAARLPLGVTTVQIPESVIDDREAAWQAYLAAVAEHPTLKIAMLGVGTGGALAARTAMRARDEPPPGVPPLLRQALISPDFNLLVGPPATTSALRTSLVALVAELPATLVQQYGARGASRLDPSQNLPELLREAGVAVRSIEYPPSRLDWTEYPRAVRSAPRALDDLVAFFERGIVADGFDVVPAWNLH
ncbi:hypothetical protein C5B96_11260 [Subtercola sp. Z020]|uniref:alpha/beta hydrolase n=1 Tax=Subtercola sp. Z020 TaxID=2080582 RepID=UPI000CE8A399|nr:hypothetical protein [Subtercola sp. Z020]PPF80160.1 hypothetical protein C5B96_11260 [Subtercola sp. Z020]